MKLPTRRGPARCKAPPRVLVSMAAALLFSGVALGQETRTYFVTDVVGSPVAAADAYGNAVWYEDYAPYGEQRISAPGSGSNQRWFTAAPQNADTGLIDAGQRYYSPEFGRFLSVDPVGVDGASGENFNRYGYANNNPYTYIDPDGQLPILLPLVIGYRIYSAYDTVTSTIDNTRTLRDPEASAGQKLRAGAEIAGAVIGGRLGRNAAGTTARVTDNAAEAARGTIHKNSLDYVGETHVYRVRGPDGSTFKIGESAQGVRASDGASIRAEQQARQLTRKTGDVYTTEIRRTFPDKASAREYETRVIERFRRMYGDDTLPGNRTNR